MTKLTHLKLYLVPLALIGAFTLFWLYFLFAPTVTQQDGIVYYLRPGIAKQTVVTELSQQGIITHPFLFSIYLYPKKSSHLKTGEYLFPKGSTPISIWRQLVTGTGHYYRIFTIIPGWSFAQLRAALLQTEYFKHVLQHIDDKQVMILLGSSDVAPEGEFFPDTYYYTRGVPDLVILKRAHDLMQMHLNAAWASRMPGLPYKNAYEALIAASLIEKEAYLDAERSKIAGVLINRLHKNMLLQIDPTVIYGIGDRYTGKIYKQDLLDNNVYNTYVHKGLPPTPIAMPSKASIDAVMRPEINDYYYYVAKGDGSHQFSKTLIEHNAAVQSVKKPPMTQIPPPVGHAASSQGAKRMAE